MGRVVLRPVVRPGLLKIASVILSVYTDNTYGGVIMDVRENNVLAQADKTRFSVLLEEHYSKPVDEIGVINEEYSEVDFGEPVGEEVW